MPYCSRCGVEVDDTVESCPLCRAPIQKFLEDGQTPCRYPAEASSVPRGSRRDLMDKMRLARTVTTFGFFIPIFIVVSVDFFLNRSITWSSYVMASLLEMWLLSMLPLFLLRRPFVIIPTAYLSALIYMFVLDVLNGNLSWAIPFGGPIMTLLAVLAAGVLMAVKFTRRKGINIAAILLSAMVVLCIGLDILINWWLTGRFSMGWSLLVAGTSLPVIALLFYLHAAVSRKKSFRFKRFFHL